MAAHAYCAGFDRGRIRRRCRPRFTGWQGSGSAGHHDHNAGGDGDNANCDGDNANGARIDRADIDCPSSPSDDGACSDCAGSDGDRAGQFYGACSDRARSDGDGADTGAAGHCAYRDDPRECAF